jgi:hypothetical protein
MARPSPDTSRRAPRPTRLARGARLLLAAAALGAATSAAEPVRLDARDAPLAEHLAPGAHVGRMRFLGMLTLPSVSFDGARLSQLSDLAWDEANGVLYAVSDKGFLFHLRPVLRDGLLVGVALERALRLRGMDGEPLRDRHADAEGLALVRAGGETELLVSFERVPRIVRFRPDGRALGPLPLPARLEDPEAYAHANRMLESLCHDPDFGVLTVPEKPLAGEETGYTRLYGLAGMSWRYPVADDNRIVGLACPGDGEVLVLEGNFGSRFWRSHATLKRVRLAGAPPDSRLEPETLFALESSRGYQIDNFEGIAHHRGRRFFLVSDDNDFFLQRTLLLYVELLEQ